MTIHQIRKKCFQFPILKIVDYLPFLRVPRIILEHSNGVELDVVPLDKCRDSLNKDAVFTAICSFDIIRDYLTLIKNWHRNQRVLISKFGYPGVISSQIRFIQYVVSRSILLDE